MEETSLPDWATLASGERVVWVGQPSPYIVKKWLAIWAAVVVAGLVSFAVLPSRFRLITRLVLLASVPVGAWAYLRYRTVRYVLTTEKLYKKTGVTRRTLETIRLDRIQNVAVSQSFGQRVVSCGNVEISTAGTGTESLVLLSVPDPQRVSGLLVNRSEFGRSSDATDTTTEGER